MGCVTLILIAFVILYGEGIGARERLISLLFASFSVCAAAKMAPDPEQPGVKC